MMAALHLAAACIAVAGDRIVARDLAPVAPAFRALAPDTELGYAPAPGSRRIFRAVELAGLLRRYREPGDAGAAGKSLDSEKPGAAGTGGGPGEICVERDMDALAPEALRAAIAATVGDPRAAIE